MNKLILPNTKLLVIVLVKNEEKHLKRFFKKLDGLLEYNVLVNDNGSSDSSEAICLENNAIIVKKAWLGNQAAQFNWIIENVKLNCDWILRLDADEYLLPETIDEINLLLKKDKSLNFNGYYLKRRHYVAGKWIKYGIYPTNIVRLFKKGFAKYSDSMLMDEHLIVEGNVSELENDFVDESLISRTKWFEKHLKYAKREAKMSFKKSVLSKPKRFYYKLPIFLRPIFLFCYLYFFRLGFLNGKNGYYWFIFQVLFYRTIVDIFILSMKIDKNHK